MMIGRMEQLAGFISELFFQAPALANFFEVLDTRSHLPELPGAAELRNVRGAVAFEDVAFGYEARPAGAVAISAFSVEPGSMVAVVGPTGAGKTTALSLLYRAHDPSRGRITIDGIDIRTVSLDSLRAHIAVVFQNPGSALPLDRRQPAHRQARRQRRRAPGRSSRRRGAPVRGRASPKATPPWSPSTGNRCPAASDSGCRSRGPC